MHENYSPMIYLITNTLNGKRYIGKTSKTLEERWSQHCKNAKYGLETYLYKSMRKHGAENFKIEFLQDGLDEEEILCIEKFAPEYNLTKGGTGGDTSKSPNYRKAMVERDNSGSNNPMFGKKGINNPNYGKTRTEKQKNKMRDCEYLKTKRRPIIVDGVYYDSVLAAAKANNRSERWVRLHGQYSG